MLYKQFWNRYVCFIFLLKNTKSEISVKIRKLFDQTSTPEQLKNFINSNNLLISLTYCNYKTKIQLYKSTKLGLIF